MLKFSPVFVGQGILPTLIIIFIISKYEEWLFRNIVSTPQKINEGQIYSFEVTKEVVH